MRYCTLQILYEYFVVKIFSDSLVYAKKMRENICAILMIMRYRGCLSEIIAQNILYSKFSRFTVLVQPFTVLNLCSHCYLDIYYPHQSSWPHANYKISLPSSMVSSRACVHLPMHKQYIILNHCFCYLISYCSRFQVIETYIALTATAQCHAYIIIR